MPAPALLALLVGTGAAAWLELPTGLPPDDDISTLAFGDGPDELYLGTRDGWVFRSRDGGASFAVLMMPLAGEPVVDRELANLRAATLGDLGWGTDRDFDPRDRSTRTRAQADLAGSVRVDLREAGFPLLASVVRPDARDVTEVRCVEVCKSGIYVATGLGLFRSRDDGTSFVRLATEPAPATGRGIDWVSCDLDEPARLIAVADTKILRSDDGGESFFANPNPLLLPETSPTTADFGPGGRILAYTDRRVLLEAADRRSWIELCDFTGDSAEAEQIEWAWWVKSGRGYAVSRDGVLSCGAEARRLPDLRLGREPVRYLWIDEHHAPHLFVATAREVFESQDGGETLDLVFTVPTQRSIQRVLTHHDRPEAPVVVTGGQLYRRLPVDPLAYDPAAAAARLSARTPLWEVLEHALARSELLAAQTNGRRTNLALRALFPSVVTRLRLGDAGTRDAFFRSTPAVDRAGTSAADEALWQVFALWDLRALVFEPLATDQSWVDLERLRARIRFRIEDHYAAWLQATVGLTDPHLTAQRRAALELRRRAAAAYLDEMTDGSFPTLAPAAPSTGENL